LRCTWYSNDPRLPTGYGEQTAQVIRRMSEDGHAVAVASNAGTVRYMSEWEGIPVYPGGLTQHSVDLIGGIYVASKSDVLFTLYDVWVLPEMELPTLSWTPIDHDPVPPEVAEYAKRPNVQTIAMSLFGQRMLEAEGIGSIYIPHAIEPVFRPTPSDWRKRQQLPEDAFVVAINAANRDHKDRKGFWQMFDALGRFQRAHADVWVYLHTWAGKDMGGLDLRWWALERGVDVDRIRKVPPAFYLFGSITKTDMAEMYSGADVLLSTSKGEGFGIPVIEAMACGTPAIVTDATAQPELVDDTGWRVRWTPEPDLAMGTTWATPDRDHIYECLEAAYAERGTVKALERSEAAQAHVRAEYDADTVYAEKWRPLLAQLEAELAPEPTPLNREQRRSQKRGKAA
jgi:glycosyltransferase involved in cell wall biosynthesis